MESFQTTACCPRSEQPSLPVELQERALAPQQVHSLFQTLNLGVTASLPLFIRLRFRNAPLLELPDEVHHGVELGARRIKVPRLIGDGLIRRLELLRLERYILLLAGLHPAILARL